MSGAADWLARVRQFEGRGELLLAYDTALQGLEAHPGDLWLAHRAVLNLAKSGATARAELEFTRLALGRAHARGRNQGRIRVSAGRRGAG